MAKKHTKSKVKSEVIWSLFIIAIASGAMSIMFSSFDISLKYLLLAILALFASGIIEASK